MKIITLLLLFLTSCSNYCSNCGGSSCPPGGSGYCENDYWDEEVKCVCPGLTYDEKQFAKLLTERNRITFCQKFTHEQRKSAMYDACYPDCGSGTNAGTAATKPDDAVSKIMRVNKIT